jgi:tRNA-binding protein
VEPAAAIQELDLAVARVAAAEPHPGARGPSSLLRLDLGPRGTMQAALPVQPEQARELVGTQVVCAVGRDDALVLAVHSHGGGVVVVRPAREVEDGSPVA